MHVPAPCSVLVVVPSEGAGRAISVRTAADEWLLGRGIRVANPTVLVVAPDPGDTEFLKYVFRAAGRHIPVAISPLDPWYLQSRLRAWFLEVHEQFVCVPGVLVKVFGVGVLIRGESRCGKSACALSLVKRGHRFVADDLVEIRRDAEGTLRGKSPPAIKNLLEHEGMGIVNMGRLFGHSAVCTVSTVDMVFDITDRGHETNAGCFRLLGVNLPRIGRSVSGAGAADAIERAVRRFRSVRHGFDVRPEGNQR